MVQMIRSLKCSCHTLLPNTSAILPQQICSRRHWKVKIFHPKTKVNNLYTIGSKVNNLTLLVASKKKKSTKHLENWILIKWWQCCKINFEFWEKNLLNFKIIFIWFKIWFYRIRHVINQSSKFWREINFLHFDINFIIPSDLKLVFWGLRLSYRENIGFQ